MRKIKPTAVSREAWAKLREWAILAGKGRLLLSGSVVLALLKAAVDLPNSFLIHSQAVLEELLREYRRAHLCDRLGGREAAGGDRTGVAGAPLRG